MTIRPFTIAVWLAVATTGCSKAAPEATDTESPVPVTTAMPTIGDITGYVHATGTVSPAPGAELLVVAPEAARIAEIPKAEGDVVRRGDLLVRFEIPSTVAEASKQRAEITRGEARLSAAQAAATRQQDLVGRGVAARRDLEDATKAVADAEADLANARAAATAAESLAARSVVRATFDGIVAKRTHNPGDLVEASAADAVLRVVDPRRLEVLAQIPLQDASRIRIGAVARIDASSSTSAGPTLTVVSHPAAVPEGAATVPVRLAFKGSPNYPVGSPVSLRVAAETHKGVVLVPSAAVIREGEETAVFVVTGEKAKRRPVMLGLEDETNAEVISGVMAGETVVTSNQNGLPDGAAITTGEKRDAAEADKKSEAKDEP